MSLNNRSLDVETICRLLADEERQSIVKYLDGRDQVFVDEVVEEASVDGVENDEFYVRLIHVHLPKLSDLDVVSYNPKQEIVYPTDVDRVSKCLDVLESQLQS